MAEHEIRCTNVYLKLQKLSIKKARACKDLPANGLNRYSGRRVQKDICGCYGTIVRDLSQQRVYFNHTGPLN